MTNVVRWGIIGTGDVAERKGGPALYLADRSELVAVTSRTLARAQAFAEQHGNPRVHDDVESLLADANVDAVYVATHPDSHANLTTAAANAGKHVLCEKPMAMSVAQTQQMVEVCRAKQVSLSIAFYRREFSVIKKLGELLKDKAIGELLSVTIQNHTPFATSDPEPWRLDFRRSGGGMLMDVGSHRLDLITHLFGMPNQVTGFAAGQTLSTQVDDAAAVSFRFENGMLGSANFHWNTPISRDDLMVVGTDGVLSITDLSGNAQLALETVEGTEYWSFSAPSPVHLPFVQRVVDHLLDGAPNPCSGEEGALVNHLLESLSTGATQARRLPQSRP